MNAVWTLAIILGYLIIGFMVPKLPILQDTLLFDDPRPLWRRVSWIVCVGAWPPLLFFVGIVALSEWMDGT